MPAVDPGSLGAKRFARFNREGLSRVPIIEVAYHPSTGVHWTLYPENIYHEAKSVSEAKRASDEHARRFGYVLVGGSAKKGSHSIHGMNAKAGSSYRGKQGSAAKRSKPQTRAEKAVKRLAEVIARGHVVHLRGAHYSGTVGPYHTATKPNEFALFVDERGARGSRGPWAYARALDAADHAVVKFGVANVIDALKAAAKRHGGSYTNLDTPIFRGR